jgi:hypothetical protein
VLARLVDVHGGFDRSELPTDLRDAGLEFVANANLRRAAADVARHLRAAHAECYGVFSDDEEVQREVLAHLESPDGPALTCADCCARLLRLADGAWVVGTSICNLKPPDALVWLSEDRVLVPAADGVIGRDVYKPELRTTLEAIREVEARFGRAPAVDWRYTVDDENAPVDTRSTMQYVGRRSGTPRAVRERLAIEARFVVAGWSVLDPPEPGDDISSPLWPAASEYRPQPWIHVRPRVLRSNAGNDRGRDVRGMELSYGRESARFHPLPDGWMLRAPTEACARATESHSASALLSASWALYRAVRLPSDLTWMDRLALIMQAREALCEPWRGAATPGSTKERWTRLASNADLGSAMTKRGWDHFDVDSIGKRSWDLRNVAMHGGDVARIALGWPAERDRPVRKRTIPGTDLTPIQIREQLEPTYAAVLHTVQWSWERMQEGAFDDQKFEGLFGSM